MPCSARCGRRRPVNLQHLLSQLWRASTPKKRELASEFCWSTTRTHLSTRSRDYLRQTGADVEVSRCGPAALNAIKDDGPWALVVLSPGPGVLLILTSPGP